MDKAQQFLVKIWERVYSTNVPAVIDCKEPSKAVQFRMAMYNAAKEIKKHPDANPHAFQAVTNCSISLRKGESTVRIAPKMMSEMLEDAARQLGMTPPGQMEEEEAAASLVRLTERLATPSTPTPQHSHDLGGANPYYTRERPANVQ